MAERFVMVKIDAEKQMQFAQSLGINSFPDARLRQARWIVSR
ncbi:MAG: hypothetical protein U0744_10830 [Gemmataceae bacterium]